MNMSKNLAYFLIPETNAPEIQLHPNEIYLIGRSPQSNILLTDSAVSREHAKLQFSDGSFILEDLGSTNGTRINNRLSERSKLSELDKLTFGRISFIFKIRTISSDRNKSLTIGDTKELDEELEKILRNMDSSPLKNQLLAFQSKFNKKKKDLIGLAYGDELTGLYNRRYFDKILDTEMRRSIRYKRTLTLIMVDIDHFKKFNDTYGHQKGDSVLRTVGAIMKENCRSSDIVCRYGGEEMVILLPEQDIGHGLKTAEKLRKKLAVEAKEIEGVEITASFGVSCTDEVTKTGVQLIRKSDKALYLAKESGRNCTKSFTGPLKA